MALHIISCTGIHACMCHVRLRAPSLGPCRSGTSEIWLGQLRLLFSFKDIRGRETEAAYIRWYDQCNVPPDAAHPGFTCFRWAILPILGSRRSRPHYDIVLLANIDAPVLLQPHPKVPGLWFHNHFFLCSG